MRRRRRHRRENKKQKRIMVIGICSIFLVMTAGYAAMQTELNISAKGNVVKKTTGGDALLDQVNVVTSGDGLYKDSYETNQYLYRGSNPNNYITFNNETWRIISVNTSDNTIKIIRNDVLTYRAYDSAGNRPQTGYCNDSDYNGCNIWGSNSTLFNTNGNPITSLAYYVGGGLLTLPNSEASLNTYLNGTYLNSTLSSTARGQIADGWFNVAVVDDSSRYSLSDNIEQSKAARWKGKIGLIDVTEHLKASTNSICDSLYDVRENSSCYKNVQSYLGISYEFWTVSPYTFSTSNSVLTVDSDGYVGNSGAAYNNSYYSVYVRPVVYLSSDIQITGGNGTSTNPYTISL